MAVYLSGGVQFNMTCGQCPEQYDAFDVQTGKKIGYVRLRHGDLRLDYPVHRGMGGVTIFEDGSGDYGDGCFDDEDTRVDMLARFATLLKAQQKEDATNDDGLEVPA